MEAKDKEIDSKEVSRRAALATAGVALAGMMAPKTAQASSERATKKDVGKISFEIANHKNSAEGFERTENKSTALNEYVNDSTYPTAQAVYNLSEEKVSYTQDAKDEGSYLFVGEDGNATLREGAVDSELKVSSTNPVAGNVIYKAIKDVNDMVAFDEKPAVCEDATCEKKHVPESGGMYHAYQEANDFPGYGDCKNGVTYRVEGAGITSTSQSWGVRRIDDAFMALCNDEFGGVYLSKSGKTDTWTPPVCEWHS